MNGKQIAVTVLTRPIGTLPPDGLVGPTTPASFSLTRLPKNQHTALKVENMVCPGAASCATVTFEATCHGCQIVCKSGNGVEDCVAWPMVIMWILG